MRQRHSPSKPTAYALVVALSFSAPAVGRAAVPDDPWESANRGFYTVYAVLDHWVIGPAARAYKSILPYPVRKGVRNLINNLKEPGIAINDMLQAHPTRSGRTVARFIVNSTAGIGGLMDVAYNLGLTYHHNGFGTTMGRYGIQPGPYIFVPVVGPSNIRDILGEVADAVTDPLAWAPFQDGQVIYARAIVDGLDQRAEADAQLQAIDDMSTDPYASLRSLYEQNRAAEIQEAVTGTSTPPEPILNDFDDPGASPAPVSAPPPAKPAPGQASPAASLEPLMDGLVARMLAKPLAPAAMNARSGALAPVEPSSAG
jgi:phospholipid-binding lipoprotein MlaA